MTRTEKACRWRIVLAFWEWQLARNVQRSGVAWYARAIGLNPLEVCP